MHRPSGLVGLHCGDPAVLSPAPSPAPLPQAVFASLPGSSSFTISLMMLQVLEKSTPVSTSSCSSLSLTPPGMFSASKQREVHLAGPADGAHAAGTQVSPPSPGAQVGAPRQGLGLSPSPCHRRGGRAVFPGPGPGTLWEEGGSWQGQACLEGPQEERAGPGDVCLHGLCRSWSNTRRT